MTDPTPAPELPIIPTAFWDPLSCTVPVDDDRRPCGLPLDDTDPLAERALDSPRHYALRWLCPTHGSQLEMVRLMPWAGDNQLPVAMHGATYGRPWPSSVPVGGGIDFNGLTYTNTTEAGELLRWRWAWSPTRVDGVEIVYLYPEGVASEYIRYPKPQDPWASLNAYAAERDAAEATPPEPASDLVIAIEHGRVTLAPLAPDRPLTWTEIERPAGEVAVTIFDGDTAVAYFAPGVVEYVFEQRYQKGANQ